MDLNCNVLYQNLIIFFLYFSISSESRKQRKFSDKLGILDRRILTGQDSMGF